MLEGQNSPGGAPIGGGHATGSLLQPVGPLWSFFVLVDASNIRIPDDFDELTEDEQQRIVGQLEAEVLSADPAVLRAQAAPT